MKKTLSSLLLFIACAVQAQYPITPVPFTSVKVSDAFWSPRLKASREVTIPLAFSKCEETGRYRNFEIAAQQLAGENTEDVKVGGFSFDDTDVYKTIEGASYILQTYPDKKLENYIDSVLAIVAKGQEPDGYLYTARTMNPRHPHPWAGMKRWEKVEELSHEFYNLGHMLEAACAHYQATGKRNFLDIAIRYADCVCKAVGPADNQLHLVPGHQIAEMGLCKLYLVTGDRKYLDQAKYFLDMRGKTARKDAYSQAHKPVTEQDEAVGHAVRAEYMYSGMADVARETSDEELLKACKTLFKNITQRKMYITGGIGSTVFGEAFTGDYDLPNDSAYAETCASIGLFFFAYRMLLCDFKAEYADIMERCIYNSILSGISESGREFFYVNPLEVIPKNCKNDERLKHIKATRQKWFGCACCPPNLARLIAGLGGYCFTQTEDTVFINLYQACTAQTENAVITIDGDYIKDGKITVKYEADKDMRLALRIPSWSNNFSFSRKNPFIKDGYAYFDISGKGEISAEFNPEIRIIQSNPAVRENIGKCAITRGPIVYCLEEADNGEGLWLLRLSRHPKFYFDGEAVFANGYRQESTKNALYYEYTEPKEKLQRLKFIPYYKWANRGENEMSVYIRI